MDMKAFPEGWKTLLLGGWDDGYAASMGGGTWGYYLYLYRWRPARKRFLRRAAPGYWRLDHAKGMGTSLPSQRAIDEATAEFLDTIRLIEKDEARLGRKR
jgi:hypothetical protein